MNKNIIIGVLVVIILAVGGYFIFTKPSSAPVTTSIPTTGQSEQTEPIAYTDAPSFSRSFLQCSSSELKMPFMGTDTLVITVFGIENNKCHYVSKVIDKNGAEVLSGADCKVPKELITEDLFGHFFGQDKAPGKEKTLAEQTKIEADYCVK